MVRNENLIPLVDEYVKNGGYSIDEFRKSILYEMADELGFEALLSFKKMWAALFYYDYDNAAYEMLNSKWHLENPVVCENLANKMRKGY